MGSASSLAVNKDHTNDKYLHELLTDSLKRENLFHVIADYKLDDHIALKDKINLKKLVAYFKISSNALYEGFEVNPDILNEALKYSVRKKKKKNSKSHKGSLIDEVNISLNDFHQFLPILLLFTRLWKVFDSADKEVVQDQKVFKGEFMKMRTHLNDFQDIQILGYYTEEDWEKEWDVINLNKDRFIDFHELCEFCIKHIHKAFNYDDFIANNIIKDDVWNHVYPEMDINNSVAIDISLNSDLIPQIIISNDVNNMNEINNEIVLGNNEILFV